jgi:hypothetical protein
MNCTICYNFFQKVDRPSVVSPRILVWLHGSSSSASHSMFITFPHLQRYEASLSSQCNQKFELMKKASAIHYTHFNITSPMWREKIKLTRE